MNLNEISLSEVGNRDSQCLTSQTEQNEFCEALSGWRRQRAKHGPTHTTTCAATQRVHLL